MTQIAESKKKAMPTGFMDHSHPEFKAEQEEAAGAELSRIAQRLEGLRKAMTPEPSMREWVKRWPSLGK